MMTLNLFVMIGSLHEEGSFLFLLCNRQRITTILKVSSMNLYTVCFKRLAARRESDDKREG